MTYPSTVYRLYDADDHEQLPLLPPPETWLERRGGWIGLLACGIIMGLSFSAIVFGILCFAL